jgi:hypothetical protein
MTPALIVLGSVALVGGIIYLVWRAEQQRTEAMRLAAQAMGFTFTERDDGVLALGFPLFDRGHSRKAKNVMAGEVGGRAVTLLDFQYTVSSGKNSTTHRQTVAVFAAAGALPDFDLAPENILHRFAGMFGYQDIDFAHAPEFSQRYLLRGPDEDAVRRVFNTDVLAFFTGEPGWSAQCRGGALAIFRSSKRCKPGETPAFLADCLRIASAFGRS